MALDNRKDAYGRSLEQAGSQAADILRRAFPGTSATLRGSGEDIAASRSIPQAAGNTVRGAAALVPAVADDVIGGAYRALAGPAAAFAGGVTGDTSGPATNPAKPQPPKARQLSLPTSAGGAPAFPGAVSQSRKAADAQGAASILSRSFDPGATDSKLGTMNAAQLEQLVANQRAHNDYMATRKAEIMDGRTPVEGGRVATIADPKTPGPSGATVRNAQDNQARVRLGEIAAGTEAAKLAAADRANTIDPTVLGKAKGAGSAFDALAALGGSNKATAEALLSALTSDLAAAPQKRIDGLMQQLLSKDATPEQANQLRSTLLALQGKEAAPRYALAESSTTDPTSGQVLRNQVPVSLQTGQYAQAPATLAGQVAAPPGMKQVGTAGGKPVFEDQKGNRFIGG